MSGVWSGTSADSTGQAKMAWTITQDGNSLTGTMSVTDAGRSMAGAGTMRGTVNGRALSFHMDVPNGGFGGMMASCAMAVDGDATISADGHTMTGTYAGTMSGMLSGGMRAQPCGGAMSSGRFTLTR